MENLEFLKNALHSAESPDIISFGFQEMANSFIRRDSGLMLTLSCGADRS